MREDLRLRKYAKENGFKEEFHWEDQRKKRFDVPEFGIQFRRGDTIIWGIRNGWQIADICMTDEDPVLRYRNHRGVKTLQEALDKVLAEQKRD